MKRLCAIFFLFFLLFQTVAIASSLRCGNKLVRKGDKTFEVLKKCGEPISKESVGYTLKNGTRELEIKEWIYDPGNSVYYYLIFHGTTLVEIESRRDPN